MQISRRSFLRYCTVASAALGVGPGELINLRRALASPTAPQVLWLQGSGCSGCSVSFLNFVSPSVPMDAAEVLIRSLNLVYHPTLSAGAGDSVVAAIKNVKNFILVVEGGVPTAFGGHACTPWSDGGKEVTFEQAVKDLAAKAVQVVCVGACAAYGGVSAMGSNPTAVSSVQKVIGKNTINVAGCPPHPNWTVATLIQLLQGQTPAVDGNGRPTSIYGWEMCGRCPYHHGGEARSFGVNGRCLEELGCKGRASSAPCPTMKWNNEVNWCVGVGAPCQGCVQPDYPNVQGRGPRGGPGGRGGRGFRGRPGGGFDY